MIVRARTGIEQLRQLSQCQRREQFSRWNGESMSSIWVRVRVRISFTDRIRVRVRCCIIALGLGLRSGVGLGSSQAGRARAHEGRLTARLSVIRAGSGQGYES